MGDRPNPKNGLTELLQRVETSLTTEERLQLSYARSRASVFNELGLDKHVAEQTPSSRALEHGEKREFMKHLDQARGQLAMGDLTDDELACAVFIHGDMSTEEKVRRYHSGEPTAIMYLTAAKERIRWLSRHLDASLTREKELNQHLIDQMEKTWAAVDQEYGGCEDRTIRLTALNYLPEEFVEKKMVERVEARSK